MNEKGLSAGLYYFPNYGRYPVYDAAQRDKSLADFQLVSYVLAECSTVDEVKEAFRRCVSSILIPVRPRCIGALPKHPEDRWCWRL